MALWDVRTACLSAWQTPTSLTRCPARPRLSVLQAGSSYAGFGGSPLGVADSRRALASALQETRSQRIQTTGRARDTNPRSPPGLPAAGLGWSSFRAARGGSLVGAAQKHCPDDGLSADWPCTRCASGTTVPQGRRGMRGSPRPGRRSEGGRRASMLFLNAAATPLAPSLFR